MISFIIQFNGNKIVAFIYRTGCKISYKSYILKSDWLLNAMVMSNCLKYKICVIVNFFSLSQENIQRQYIEKKMRNRTRPIEIKNYIDT